MPEQATRSEYAASYTSFAGCDMKAVMGSKTIGELQAISVQVTREKAGIYTMGSPEPRSFSRGKRGIAGSMIVVQFDRDAITEALRDLKFQADIDELRPDHPGDTSLEWSIRNAESGRTPSTPLGAGIDTNPSTIQQESELTSIESDQEIAAPHYADQIPPFDVTLAAANEYGDIATMGVFGVEFLNEGWGISIDDLVSEKQYTYLARSVAWWKWVANPRVSELRATGASFQLTFLYNPSILLV